MKIGEIKVEALKLMFANYAFDMGIDDLQNMTSDENYGSYIVNMNGSISRAIDRIQNACAVPPKAHHIRDDELMAGGYFNRFDTATIADLYVIDRLIAESVSGYDGNAEYHLEGTKIVLKGGAAYTLLYFPVLKAIDGSASDYIDLKDMGNPRPYSAADPVVHQGRPVPGRGTVACRRRKEYLRDVARRPQTKHCKQTEQGEAGVMGIRVNRNLSAKERSVHTFDNFKGVDFTTSPHKVSGNRATQATNLIYKDGTVRKRNGWESLRRLPTVRIIQEAYLDDNDELVPAVTEEISNRINGIFQFELDGEDIILCYAGTRFYRLEWNEQFRRYDSADVTDTCTYALAALQSERPLADRRIQLYINDNKAYIIGCGDYLVYGKWGRRV